MGLCGKECLSIRGQGMRARPAIRRGINFWRWGGLGLGIAGCATILAVICGVAGQPVRRVIVAIVGEESHLDRTGWPALLYDHRLQAFSTETREHAGPWARSPGI